MSQHVHGNSNYGFGSLRQLTVSRVRRDAFALLPFWIVTMYNHPRSLNRRNRVRKEASCCEVLEFRSGESECRVSVFHRHSFTRFLVLSFWADVTIADDSRGHPPATVL